MKKIIIDVREKFEYKTGHADNAINIPLSGLRNNAILNDLSKDDELILYCRSGHRSAMAIATLKEKGFKNLVNGKTLANVKTNYPK